MPATYTGSAGNASSNTPAVTIMQDGDALNAASATVSIKLLTDYAARLVTFIVGLFSTANTWTAEQTYSVNTSAAAISATQAGIGIAVFGVNSSSGSGVTGSNTGSGSAMAANASAGSGVALLATGNTTRGPLNLVPQATPGSPSNGDVWVDTSNGTFSARVGGGTLELGVQSGPNLVSSIGFGTNWSAVGATNPRYYLDPGGFVHLSGEVKCSATGSSTAFTLPAGFRPNIQVNGMAPDLSVPSMTAYSITTGGAVDITNPNASDTISLDGISFATF